MNIFSNRSNKKTSTYLTFVTVAKKWNSVMEYNLENCKKNNIPFLWVKHVDTISEEFEFSFSQNSTYFSILECKSSKNYVEGLLFWAIQFLNCESWFLRIDSDELLSCNSISVIKDSIPNLDIKYVYRLKRLWIQRITQDYFYSKNAKKIGDKHDFQSRLFYSKTIVLDDKIHSPGFVVKKFHDLDQGVAIIHLVWIIANLKERIEKIKSYEIISLNAGVSKIRYYLPEIFSETTHGWTLVNSEDQLAVEEWSNTHNRKG